MDYNIDSFCHSLSYDVGFMLIPTQSKLFVDTLRGFFGDTIGIYYVILGLGCVLLSLYLAFKDKYGQIKLGNIDKPVYSNFAWGTMIFTSTMAADIMFLFLDRVGFVWCRTSCGRTRKDAALGTDLPIVPLGTISVGILCGTCYQFCFYDACAQTRETTFLRGSTSFDW